MSSNSQIPKNKPVRAILKEDAQFAAIMDKALSLGRLQQWLEEFLDPAALEHCQVANYEDQHMVLQVSSGAWATHIRFLCPSIKEFFKEKGLRSLQQVQCKVVPHSTEQKAEPLPKAKPISSNSRQVIATMAEGLNHPSLRAALLKLSEGKSS